MSQHFKGKEYYQRGQTQLEQQYMKRYDQYKPLHQDYHYTKYYDKEMCQICRQYLIDGFSTQNCACGKRINGSFHLKKKSIIPDKGLFKYANTTYKIYNQ